MTLTTRPIFRPGDLMDGGVDTFHVSFSAQDGKTDIHKREARIALHETCVRGGHARNPLEISKHSNKELGSLLSGNCLTIKVGRNLVTVLDLYRAMKSDADDNNIISIAQKKFPLNTRSGLYEYLYLYALRQNQNQILAEELFKHDAFTDITSKCSDLKHCDARICALYMSLALKDELNAVLKSPQAYSKAMKKFNSPYNGKQMSMF